MNAPSSPLAQDVLRAFRFLLQSQELDAAVATELARTMLREASAQQLEAAQAARAAQDAQAQGAG
jgi:hypothetical protein